MESLETLPSRDFSRPPPGTTSKRREEKGRKPAALTDNAASGIVFKVRNISANNPMTLDPWLERSVSWRSTALTQKAVALDRQRGTASRETDSTHHQVPRARTRQDRIQAPGSNPGYCAVSVLTKRCNAREGPASCPAGYVARQHRDDCAPTYSRALLITPDG